ncbi:unnamed protein product [Sphenostylis stenocarpa]|uniref:Purple acid phosphatase Fn3-like domain-containing protein n=1 Tax=Sphenostylis stenocarpa TaxID=92480 RepID=A0AA86T5W8_9FABA|nr:unnamed protein product [Sphenostylis stenocarpa]
MIFLMLCFTNLGMVLGHSHMNGFGEQPLAKIAIHKTVLALHSSASITAVPFVLGIKGEDTERVTVELESPKPSVDDWVGVFSPANFNSALASLPALVTVEEKHAVAEMQSLTCFKL